MKGNIHTIRGEIPWRHALTPNFVLPPQQIYLDNMDFTRNFRVVDFKVFPMGPTKVTTSLFSMDAQMVWLATKKSGAIPARSVPDKVQGCSVRDNRQIGWCVWDGMVGATIPQTVLDPTHLVVSDLWINGFQIDGGAGDFYTFNQPVGYIITLELVTTTLDEALMALLRERAQDTLAH